MKNNVINFEISENRQGALILLESKSKIVDFVNRDTKFVRCRSMNFEYFEIKLNLPTLKRYSVFKEVNIKLLNDYKLFEAVKKLKNTEIDTKKYNRIFMII